MEMKISERSLYIYESFKKICTGEKGYRVLAAICLLLSEFYKEMEEQQKNYTKEKFFEDIKTSIDHSIKKIEERDKESN